MWEATMSGMFVADEYPTALSRLFTNQLISYEHVAPIFEERFRVLQHVKPLVIDNGSVPRLAQPYSPFLA